MLDEDPAGWTSAVFVLKPATRHLECWRQAGDRGGGCPGCEAADSVACDKVLCRSLQKLQERMAKGFVPGVRPRPLSWELGR